jgi:hypothetical protein
LESPRADGRGHRLERGPPGEPRADEGTRVDLAPRPPADILQGLRPGSGSCAVFRGIPGVYVEPRTREAFPPSTRRDTVNFRATAAPRPATKVSHREAVPKRQW